MSVLFDIIKDTVELEGVVAGAIVEIESGTCLVRDGGEDLFSLSLIGLINAQILRSQMQMVVEQFPQESIEDIVITLGKHCHLIRLIPNPTNMPRFFLYVVLDRDGGHVAMIRHKMTEMANLICLSQPVSPQEEKPPYSTLPQYPQSASEEEEIPPFMCEETVMKLLATMEASYPYRISA